MIRWPDSHFTSIDLGLILMPNRLESGCNQTHLKGLTDSFAAPHETHNHLIEALKTLVLYMITSQFGISADSNVNLSGLSKCMLSRGPGKSS